MTTRQEGLPPQGIRTPSGRRGGITVPGPSSSLSNDGLPEVLLPSTSGEAVIGFSALQAILDRADRADERADDAAVIAAVGEFVRVIPRFTPPPDVSRSEREAMFNMWPTLLDFFANGVGALDSFERLSPEAEDLVAQLDDHIVQLKMRPEVPDPERIRKFWDHLRPLRDLLTPRLRGGVSDRDEPAGGWVGSRDSLSSSSSAVPPLSASSDQGGMVAALREENRVLRAELLKEKGEREKLRNYIRAHSPHFGASAGGPSSVAGGATSAPGSAGESVVEAGSAPLPPSPGVSSPATVIMEVEEGGAPSSPVAAGGGEVSLSSSCGSHRRRYSVGGDSPRSARC